MAWDDQYHDAAHNGGDPIITATPPSWDELYQDAHPDVIKGLLKAGGQGLRDFVTGTIGMPRAMSDLADSGFDALHVNGPARDLLKAATGGALGFPAQLAHALPTEAQVDAPITKTFGAPYTPQTIPEKYIRSIAGQLPAVALPGGLAARLARAVVPGVTSEAAGEVAQGTPYEGAARAVGGLAGGLGVGGAEYIASTPQRLMQTAMGGATQADVVAATDLMKRAQGLGLRITPAEALQRVTNGATSMTALQGFAENTRYGGPVMRGAMASRATDSEAAVHNLADQIAPATSEPSALATQAQGAAKGALDSTRRDINAATKPNYDALRGQEMPMADYQHLEAHPSYQRALADLRGDPELGPLVAGLPDNNMAVINEARKRLGDLQKQAVEAGDNQLAMERTKAASGVDTAAGQFIAPATPAFPDWVTAHAIQAQRRAAELAPLEAGPVGGVARSSNIQGQTQALFPAAPPAGGAAETSKAIDLLNQQNPDLAAALLRQHVLGGRAGAVEKLQDLAGGPNQRGGPAWAASVSGNPEQRAALMSGAQTIGGDPLSQHLGDLLDTFGAMGYREGANSATHLRGEYGKALEEIVPKIGDLINDPAAHIRAQRLAKMLSESDPTTAGRILSEALHRPPVHPMIGRNALIAAALANNGAPP